MTNQRRKAAEAADDLRENMEEILSTPAAEGYEIRAKIEAAAALEGIQRAEDALRLWRDHEEEPIEILGEEPLDAPDDETDATEEIQQALEHVEAAASLLDDGDKDDSSQ